MCRTVTVVPYGAITLFKLMEFADHDRVQVRKDGLLKVFTEHIK